MVVRPEQWAVEPDLVHPDWGWFWERAYVSVPLFDGTAYDVVRGRQYTISGAARGDTVFGQSLNFTASGHYIDCGSIPGLLDAVSVVWYGIATSNPPSFNGILAGFYKNTSPFQGWGLSLNSTGSDKVHFWDGTGWRTGASTVVADTKNPQMFAATYDGSMSNVALYLNGEHDGDVGSVSALSAWDGDKRLQGLANTGANGYSSCSVGYYHISNSVWTAGQHKMLFDDPFGPFTMADDEPIYWAIAGGGGPAAWPHNFQGVGNSSIFSIKGVEKTDISKVSGT